MYFNRVVNSAAVGGLGVVQFDVPITGYVASDASVNYDRSEMTGGNNDMLIIQTVWK